MDQEAAKLFSRVLIEQTESVACRYGIKGFRPADVFLFSKKNQVVKTALRSRFVSEYELRTRISQTLCTRTFQGAPRFLRVSNERPGLWKAIDFCNSAEVMEAVKNRSRHIESVKTQREYIFKTAERMFETGERFSDAWKYVKAV